MHPEAIPIVEDDDEPRTGADAVSESRLTTLEAEFDAHFQTTRVYGRPYVLVATPFGD